MLQFRSKFEKGVWDALTARQRKATEYEPKDRRFDYTLDFKYLPDFVIVRGNDRYIFVETKGRLTNADRRKMLAVKKAYPDADIRFVFMRASNPIRKGSKTTYGDWATANDFPWAEGAIPEAWYTE